MWTAVCVGGLVGIGIIVLAYALCVAASRGDAHLQEIAEAVLRKETNDGT